MTTPTTASERALALIAEMAVRRTGDFGASYSGEVFNLDPSDYREARAIAALPDFPKPEDEATRVCREIAEKHGYAWGARGGIFQSALSAAYHAGQSATDKALVEALREIARGTFTPSAIAIAALAAADRRQGL